MTLRDLDREWRRGRGAAGSSHASITALDCIVDADEVAEKAGGGARCAYNP